MMGLRHILGSVILLIVILAVSAQQQVVATGWVTDTRCGAKGANALHVDCAKRNVASGKGKYALYDKQTRKLYVLEQQEMAVPYLGQRVQITGTVSFSEQWNSEVLHVLTVSPAPPPGSKSKQ